MLPRWKKKIKLTLQVTTLLIECWCTLACFSDCWRQGIVSSCKFTLEQSAKAQRGSRCIALLFPQPQRKMGVGDERHAPTALPPGKTR